MLASWHRHNAALDEDFTAHSLDAQALGDATEALGEATGTAALDRWNDAPERNLSDLLAAIDHAVGRLNGSG